MKIIFILIMMGVVLMASDIKNKSNWKKLTSEEERVIIKKGTEYPFTGEYENHFQKGVYKCKQCGNPLYLSDSKFHSGCGWPSFDDEIEGAVLRIPDQDGHRTEIVCSNCKGHLGHVFTGEGFTEKDIRHCVNSISMTFEPVKNFQYEKAIFASGCFWGTEFMFKKLKGVVETAVGYSGGDTENPTYKQVCTGETGHAEAIEIVFDPSVISYDELVKYFFETHNPEHIDRQGPDIGEQYRSVIFYFDDKQKRIAEKYVSELTNKGYKVATKLEKNKPFWKAEEYHQDYYEKTGGAPYCHSFTKRF
ncbi:MAG: bifunctional methionine sulfoxide reductase B/A protein [Candidatus Delongbacteria bacterium]|nr:bifunctional methionine sulfoxide reductase B/A protein [Candidatus Delongbacteria bacterium]MBN2833809.1 bifunctional methionine sulfoxide reductase B/A protein [Candidatus Delongbacteria bacterium]